jgi:hypothetical protein
MRLLTFLLISVSCFAELAVVVLAVILILQWRSRENRSR